MTNEPANIQVTKKELPISCPPKDSPAWNMHPRVFIELSKESQGRCPYCGALYELVAD